MCNGPTFAKMCLPSLHIQVSGELDLNWLKKLASNGSEDAQRLVRVLDHGRDLRQGQVLLAKILKSFLKCAGSEHQKVHYLSHCLNSKLIVLLAKIRYLVCYI